MVCFCPFYDMLKKEQPVFQGCPFILSNPTRQDVKHQRAHET